MFYFLSTLVFYEIFHLIENEEESLSEIKDISPSVESQVSEIGI